MNFRYSSREVINYFVKHNRLTKNLPKLKNKNSSKAQEIEIHTHIPTDFQIRRRITPKPLVLNKKFFPPSKPVTGRNSNYLFPNLPKSNSGDNSTYSSIQNSDEDLSDSSILNILEKL